MKTEKNDFSYKPSEMHRFIFVDKSGMYVLTRPLYCVLVGRFLRLFVNCVMMCGEKPAMAEAAKSRRGQKDSERARGEEHEGERRGSRRQRKSPGV